MPDLLPFLIHLIGLRDPHAEGHSNHVGSLAVTIGRKVDLTAAQLKTLEFAATIHDVGKIAINDFIIHKPGRFTEAEYMMVQQHTVLGARIMEKLDIDPLITSTILYHHENFDGTGYLHRLRGDQIPLEARIIRIADTYDALTTNRGYRPAYTHKQALGVMEKDQVVFDPQLLELFFHIKPSHFQ